MRTGAFILHLVFALAYGRYAGAQDDAESETEETVAAPAEDAVAAAFDAGFAVGLGMTQRRIEFGGAEGARRLDTGWIPALSLRMQMRAIQGSFVFGAAVHYQTSIHATGVQYNSDPGSQPLTTDLRTHRLEIGLTPAWRFAQRDRGVSLGLFAGYGLRALASVSPLRVPRFTLHGPMLRVELEIPIIPGRLRLRIAPEGSLIISMTRELRRESFSAPAAFALGGEAALSGRLLDGLQAELSYRESHALADSRSAPEFSDVERFVMLDALLTF